MSRGEQLQRIDQVTDSIPTDRAMSELAGLVEQEGLTVAQNHGKVDIVGAYARAGLMRMPSLDEFVELQSSNSPHTKTSLPGIGT